MPAGTGDAASCSLVEHVVVPLGLDVRARACSSPPASTRTSDDPLAGCRVTTRGLRGDGRRACGGLAEELGVPLGLVLEGGYDLGALAALDGRVDARWSRAERRPRSPAG